MNRIAQLDILVANQIAAGEVVERPACIIKELVENSLDAQATKIEIDIEGGGIHLIRVRDNGVGIHKDDLTLAFSRHATSKIRVSDDLHKIRSLGFRGEALASIASVAKCRLVSLKKAEKQAWEIQIMSDLSVKLTPTAHLVGTTIEVADLFYNTPVRRRFLRSEKSEFLRIDEIVKKLALSYPHVTFILRHQQKIIRHYHGAGDHAALKDQIAKICGNNFIDNARAVSFNATGLSLQGWIGVIPNRRQADCQYFFVNQRMVKDRLLYHAIKNVYQNQANDGNYPAYVLYLSVAPEEVDVNVHPTKQEVRFSQPRLIHDFITQALEQALAQSSIHKKTAVATTLPVDSKRVQTQTAVQLTSSSAISEYAIFENAKAEWIILDLQKSKEAILTTYFEKHLASNSITIKTRNILFPQRNRLNSVTADNFLKLASTLQAIGYEWNFQDHNLSLVKLPFFIQEQDYQKQFLLFLEKYTFSCDKAHFYRLLVTTFTLKSMHCFLQLEKDFVIQEWLEHAPKGCYVTLTTGILAKLFDKPALVF